MSARPRITAEQRRADSVVTAEQSAIGGLLIDPSRLDTIELVPDDFARREHAMIYRAMLELSRAGIDIDSITVSNILTRDGNIEAAGGLSYVASLANNTPSAANVASYAKIVRAASVGRRARAIMTEAMTDMVDSDEREVVDRVVGELMHLTEGGVVQHECTISDAALMAVDRLDYLFRNPNVMVGITTGVKKLDAELGGFQEGDLYVIGARPSMGKTALLLNFASAAGRSRVPVGVFSAEQPRIQIGQRMLSLFGKIVASRMRTGKLEDSDWPKLTAALSDLRDVPLYINDRPGATITHVVRQARRWRHDKGVKCVYVDYLQLIRGTDPRAKKHEQVDEVTWELKQCARELGIPIVALAQVARDVEKREDKRPRMADLSDSSAIEKHADSVLTLYRDEVYDRNTKNKGIAEIGICKNRHGPIGRVYVRWEKHYMAFDEIAEEDGQLNQDDAEQRGGDK